ncbi:MAG TPA: acyl-CoA dehydrogenase family protein [Thermoanaerobaculia bacterium]|jgi:glutaryl-CoA dehydrogenase (non-decarboxylating)|nr:acyl-CoA dehydrogenase family protein [Thermoanaerobaculia bacterium]
MSEPGEAGLRLELSPAQREARRRCRAFVAEHVAPHAASWDRAARLPDAAIAELRRHGYLGAHLASELGGGGVDPITYGLLTEEIGRGCSSLRSLLTVHDMVSEAVRRWGGPRLKGEVLPRLARAEQLAALALSEPNVGSDAAGVETEAERDGDAWVLSGNKRWITFGMSADLFLVVARHGGQVAAFLVPAAAPGLTREPIGGVVGTRAARLAEVTLDRCRVPADHLLGRVGFGLSHVAATALDLGRYSVAWGAVGIAQACVDACLEYTASRRQFGKPLAGHQLVQRKLTEMIVNTRAARLLCLQAGYRRSIGAPDAASETLIAKYFASRTATRAANDAVQLHGANGLSQDFPVERYLRDAKVTEIIEGSTQIQQIAIASYPPGELLG